MNTPLLRQIWTTSAVLINMFGLGLMLGHTAILVSAILHPDSPIKTNLQTLSWLVSISGIAGVPGFLLASTLMDLYGRRIAHAITILPGIAGWLLTYLARDIPMLMAGRFLSGMSATAGTTTGAIVIGEFSNSKYRGIILSFKNVSVFIAVMLTHIFSLYLDWQTIALWSILPHLIALFVTYTWPESPAWLASKHQFEKSRKAFYWLRGDNDASRREIESMIKVQKSTIQNMNPNLYAKVTYFVQKFTKKSFLRPLYVMSLAIVVLEVSGRHTFPAFSLQIMSDITGETTRSFYYTLGVDFIMTISAIVSSVLMKVMNRRTLLFSTASVALVVLALSCTCMFLASKDIISDDKSWICISLLVVYFIFVNLGCATIPLTLIGELFPLAHKGVGSALSGIWVSLCYFAGLESTPYLLDSIRAYGLFAVYGLIMAVALLMLYFVMPETKDKTLQEIENYFHCNRFTDDVEDLEESNVKMIK